MINFPRILTFLVIVFSLQLLGAQVKEAGPVIAEYGKVWKIEEPDLILDTDREYKAVFDIMNSPDSHETVNPSIETVARFLNMHAQSGVPIDKLSAVVVIHNKASKDVMSNSAYNSRYGFDNPNYELIRSLNAAGVEIVFCGQSSLSRDIPKSNIMDEVRIALSAMTVLIHYQDNGYRLIKF